MLSAMSDPLRDPELDELVRELNRKNASDPLSGGEADLQLESYEGPSFLPALALRAPSQLLVGEGEPLDRYLTEMIQQKASDLLLIPGLPPIFRINGRLLRAEERGALEGEEIGKLFHPHLGGKERQELAESGSTDFSLNVSHGRAAGDGFVAA